MKVKLLKKLRKKYSWYFNKDKFPVLLNHELKTVIVYDVDECASRFTNKTKEVLLKEIEVEHHVWALRIMKRDILSRYGYSIEYSNYKLAMYRLKKKQS